MKLAEQYRRIAKNWLKEGLYNQMARHAENGLLECRVHLFAASKVEVENLLLDLENNGFRFWWESKPILVVSWADSGSPELD